MADNRTTSLVDETIRQLDNIMNITPRQAAKDVVKKAMGRSVRSKDPMFWPSGMLILGLVTSLGILKEDDKLKAKALKSLDDHLKLWQTRYGGRLDFVDDALAGYGVIRLYEKTQDQTHRQIIDRINQFVLEAPTDYAGSIIYNKGKGNTCIFSDGIGQTTMFMAAFIRMKMIIQEQLYDGRNESEIQYYSESDYLNEISKLYIQFINFYRYGRDKKSGLIYHGYSLIGRNDLDYDSRKTIAARVAKEYSMEHECQRHGLLE